MQDITWQMTKQQKLRFGRFPRIAAAVASYHEGNQHPYVPLTIEWQSGGFLYVLALVDTEAEVTILHSNTDTKEATSQIRGLEGNPTLALHAKLP